VHHVGILYDQFMMHGQRNIKFPILVVSFERILFQQVLSAQFYTWKTSYAHEISEPKLRASH